LCQHCAAKAMRRLIRPHLCRQDQHEHKEGRHKKRQHSHWRKNSRLQQPLAMDVFCFYYSNGEGDTAALGITSRRRRDSQKYTAGY
jgi:hypothetical protein